MPRRFSPIFTELDLAIQVSLQKYGLKKHGGQLSTNNGFRKKVILSKLINTTKVLRQKK
jgi:hypothetical protein